MMIVPAIFYIFILHHSLRVNGMAGKFSCLSNSYSETLHDSRVFIHSKNIVQILEEIYPCPDYPRGYSMFHVPVFQYRPPLIGASIPSSSYSFLPGCVGAVGGCGRCRMMAGRRKGSLPPNSWWSYLCIELQVDYIDYIRKADPLDGASGTSRALGNLWKILSSVL